MPDNFFPNSTEIAVARLSPYKANTNNAAHLRKRHSYHPHLSKKFDDLTQRTKMSAERSDRRPNSV